MTSRLAISVGLVSLGVITILASFWAAKSLRPIDFWSAEDRAELSQLDARYLKLRLAYVTENARRSAAGKPPLSVIPPAVEKADAALALSKAKLLAARERPKQIATWLRWAGAALLGAGLLALRGVNSVTRSPSASDGEADQ